MTIRNKMLNYIESEIKDKLVEEYPLEIRLDKLSIQGSSFNMDEVFMDGICKYLQSKGLFLRYRYHISFIWRHVLYVSTKEFQGDKYYTVDFDKNSIIETEISGYKIFGFNSRQDAEKHLKYIVEFNKSFYK